MPRTTWLTIVAALLAWRCGGGPVSPSLTAGVDGPPAVGGLLPSGRGVPAPPAAFASGPQTLVGAGDIAMCDINAENTARLLDGIGGTVFTAGDNAYFSGTRAEFADCYDPTWGRHRARTRPAPGNHEYETPGAGPYYEYFGSNAGPPGRGYYAFTLGSWRILSLNSNVGVEEGSAQFEWLRAELMTNPSTCTMAIWHHPLFSNGPSGPTLQMRAFWRLLYEHGADVVVNGHEHFYQRAAPQDPDGRPDQARGLRQFIVGTGGAFLYPFGASLPNVEMQISQFGVIQFTLEADRYDWRFIPVSGVGDSGSAACH